MNGSEALAAADILPRRSLRNIGLLAVCQALTQGSNTLMFASSALAVLTIVPADMRVWANLPITMQHLGVMLSVFPASMLMQRAGRRLGFRLGSLMGMLGASCAAIGLGMGSFLVMCLGGLMLGNAVACMQLYRFAAVELAPGRFRAQAISYVTAGGIFAGIIGPTWRTTRRNFGYRPSRQASLPSSAFISSYSACWGSSNSRPCRGKKPQARKGRFSKSSHSRPIWLRHPAG